MTDNSKRDQWDQHNRDEAKERAAQQEAAGPGHRPVPTAAYANVVGSPALPHADLDVAALIDEYERATAAERQAWLAVRDLLAHDSGAAIWNAWRDAVERTQRAARSIVDYATARCAPG